jgi:hypothetical protein
MQEVQVQVQVEQDLQIVFQVHQLLMLAEEVEVLKALVNLIPQEQEDQVVEAREDFQEMHLR